MSVTEILEQVKALTPAERKEVANADSPTPKRICI